MLKEIRWYLELALFLALSLVISWLPGRSADWVGRRLGRLFFFLLKERRRIALENIERALPFLEAQPGWVRRTPHELARETFENLGRSLLEDCKIYHGHGRRLIDTVEFRGQEHFERAREKGKGVAFITAHCGNWDLMALAFGARIQELTVVARRQDNPHLNDVLERIRKAYGNRVFYKSSALRAMLGAFKRGETVGMLIDQAVGADEGILIEFLGRPAWATKLPAYIAKKAGTPMVPAFIHREGNHHVMTSYPELIPSTASDPERAAAEDVQALNRCIERYIVEHPTEWYWIHKRWKNTDGLSAPVPGGSDAP
ncbi:acyltransferase [Geomonas limicola]|uniref:Acyltransferase n=1 Tax=Geomonas limicola TaxID=2740186 RepID=A0A6V8NE54_9BACT|nr:lysophospholipid acyltransferase family protein [Geomonas limicola]GFO70720.1 acyltransferase [Geomonas limicola]